MADRRRRVQMIFQDPFSSLNPRMTVGAAIPRRSPFAADPAAASRSRRSGDYLDLVHLDTALADQPPSRLSGGQRQRVAIARALAARPRC